MTPLSERIAKALAMPHDHKLLFSWPTKQMAIGSGNKYRAYMLGTSDEHARTAPIVAELRDVAVCAQALITNYAEAKHAVETHRVRTIHISSEKMLAVHDALTRLEAAIEGRT